MTGYQTFWRESPAHKWIRGMETQYDFRREMDMNYILGRLATQGHFDGQAAYQTVEIVGGKRPSDLVGQREKMDEVRTVLDPRIARKETAK